MNAIGVIGAGQMGAGIAQVSAAAGYAVYLSDLSLDLDPSASDVRTVENVRPSGDRLQSARTSGFVDLELPDDPDSKYEDDGDPLERKLDLADEFRQIGDLEGARDLLNEVLAQADDGALRQKAQTMLDALG